MSRSSSLLTRIAAWKVDMGILQILCVVDHDEAVVAVAIAVRAENGVQVARILIRLTGSAMDT